MEDEGVGSIMAKLADKAPGHIAMPAAVETASDSGTDFAGRHRPEQYEKRQLGREPISSGRGNEGLTETNVRDRLAVPMDFAAEARKRMGVVESPRRDKLPKEPRKESKSS